MPATKLVRLVAAISFLPIHVSIAQIGSPFDSGRPPMPELTSSETEDEPAVRTTSWDSGVVEFTDPNALCDAPDCDAGCDEPSDDCDAESEDGEDGKPKCDCEKWKELRGKIGTAHKGLFYDNDFSYICDPCYCEWWPGDELKRVCIGNCGVLDIGGQYRARGMFEQNFRGLGLTGRDDDFLLHRTRIFANAEFGGVARAYVEYIDAESNYEDFTPRPIEVNRSDLLNAFGDLKLLDNARGELWARAGRQELLYGAQRLISPLDWANTRRTFEGYKVFWKGEDWNIDGFYTRPVFPNDVKFDSPDYDQEFMSIYSTYKGRENNTFDFYYVRYNNFRGPNNFKYDTIGGRWQGKQCSLLWEFEGAYQFGDNTDGSDHSAGMWVAGLGRAFESHCWKPTVWAYYDWASGDDTLGNGYDHLFPLAHKYLGFMDLFGRRNIETINVQVTAQPHERVKLLAWWYAFWLQNGNDVPYTVVMTPSPTLPGVTVVPGGSQYLGQELDLTATITVNPRTSLLLGYSHFWSGSWYNTNPSNLPFRGDADFFYSQLHFNF